MGKGRDGRKGSGLLGRGMVGGEGVIGREDHVEMEIQLQGDIGEG